MSDIRRYAETALAIQKELSVEDRELAHKLYINLIQIERLTYAWPHFGGWAGVLIGMGLALILEIKFQIDNRMLLSAIIFGYYLIWFLIGMGVCKVAVTNSKRRQALHRLKGLQIADSRFYEVLRKLNELDPRIFKNIGKFLPEVNTAA